MKIVNPASGALIRELEEDTPATIEKKLARSRAAQPGWAALPLSDRIEVIRRFRQEVERRKEELAAVLCEEVGKPITQARNEVQGLFPRIDFFLDNVARVMSDQVVLADQGMEERIRHEPLGVVGNVSAWNYPYFIAANVLLPALLTGNAVLYKPSEFSSLTGLAMARALHDAGVPEAIFTPVIGGAAVGTALIKQPLDGLFFTGSYATGRRVATESAHHLLRLQLELGGKDPAYVCDDVDVAAAAAATADGAFYNNGQSCCAVERIYVHERIHSAFVEAFVSEVGKFRQGDPTEPETYLGPVTREAQLSVLADQVKDALQKGATCVLGGQRVSRPGFFFAPTVFTGVSHEMKLMREETFGPLIGIQKVTGDEEALALMNDTEYGLTAAVYSRDRQRAERILSRTNAGSVYWNCCDRVSPRLPWSGRGHSGVGCTLSTYGIEAFLRLKAWHLRSA